MRWIVVVLGLGVLAACGAPEPACSTRSGADAPDVYCANGADWQPGDGAWYPYCSDEAPPQSLAEPSPSYEADAYCVEGEATCPHAFFRCVWVEHVAGTRP